MGYLLWVSQREVLVILLSFALWLLGIVPNLALFGYLNDKKPIRNALLSLVWPFTTVYLFIFAVWDLQ